VWGLQYLQCLNLDSSCVSEAILEVNPDDDAMPVVFQMILVENIHTQEEERGREGSVMISLLLSYS